MTTDKESLSPEAIAPAMRIITPGTGAPSNLPIRQPGDPIDPSGPGPGYPSAVFRLINLNDGKVCGEPRLGLASPFSISVSTNDNPVGELSILSDDPKDHFTWNKSRADDADFAWNVEGNFPSPGPRTIRLSVPWTHITQTNPPKSNAEVWTRVLLVTVAPTNRQPLGTVNIDGIRAQTADPAIRLPIGGPSTVGVDVYPDTNTAPATKSVTAALKFDGIKLTPIALTKRVQSNGIVIWGNPQAIVLDPTMAPRPIPGKPDPVVVIEDTDFFGVTTAEEFRIETIDFTPPVLEIADDQIFKVGEVSVAKPATIRILGSIKDIQSGYKENSLVYTFGERANQQATVVNGAVTVELKITSYGQAQFSISAEDNASKPNRIDPPRVVQFSVVPGYKPGTIDELLSARAYLDELLRFASTHVLIRPTSRGKQPAFITPEILRQWFKQDFGGLARLGADDAETPVSNLLVPMRVLRSHTQVELGAFAELVSLGLDPVKVVSEAAVALYHEVVHQALLRALGTSLEELRSLRTWSAAQRRELAARLDLVNGQDDFLDELMPPAYGPTKGTAGFEKWLADQFGMPPIDGTVTSTTGVPRILDLRQKLLTSRWARLDKSRHVPDIDPDLVEAADLSQGFAATEWRKLLARRQAQLASFFEQLRGIELAHEMAEQIMDREEVEGLLALADAEAKGMDVSSKLLFRNVPIPPAVFRRVVSYLRMGSGAPVRLTQAEREDLAHIFIRIWTPDLWHGEWANEEAQITASQLWPTAGTAAAWVPGNYRRVFLPWRGDVASRVALERRLAERAAQWQQLLDDQQKMIISVQQRALPVLRTALLGDPTTSDTARKLFDGLSKRFLIDFAVSGSALVTPLVHATACMQTLIEGVSRKRFPIGHPAKEWLILPAYQNGFQDEWRWLGTFGQWRAAVMNYLYPENALYPELIDPTNDAHKLVFDFLGQLSKLMPLNARSFDRPPADYTTALLAIRDSNQREHLVPLSIGLAYQRSGQYLLALTEYRKIYDWSMPTGERERVPWLIAERPNKPPTPNFTQFDQWTLKLSNPFEIARPSFVIRWGNPHTKFVVFQILECLLTMADQQFAAGTSDSLARALALYLEADDILGFPEMQDKKPIDPYQVDLPSPVLAAKRAHVASALRKIRAGLSYLGTTMLDDLTAQSNARTVAGQVRSSPYRFKTLMERAKQLTALAQQFESQYLSAIERNEIELEKILSAESTFDITDKTVELRSRTLIEAKTAKALAEAQGTRSSIQQARYSDWIAAGASASERQQIEAIKSTLAFRNQVTTFDAEIAHLQAAGSAVSVSKFFDSYGVANTAEAAVSILAVQKGISQGFLNEQETNIQLSAIQASQERRSQEWQLQADLAAQDVAINGVQVTLAQDRIAISDQEAVIASAQQLHARQMLSYLTSGKFTNAAFYEWLAGVLAEIYAFFLRIAAAAGTQAELQLAFERQEQPVGFLKNDYWRLAGSSSTGGDSSKDRRGITGSARLAQDLYALDQRAFETDRRVLNLVQAFSLSRLMPIEFEQFRKTGSLVFATPMSWFDEGFPGHYMRLIKRVRLTVAALIPPSQGIRATLVNNGLTRVVTGDPGFPTVVIRQDPEMVALTSPNSSTGVFELDMQSELLLPFEGLGVDSTWFLELPRAANPIDFDSLVDVVLTVEYTARYSAELRERVVKAMPMTASGVRTFSVRRDLPDTWYELANSTASTASIVVNLARTNFPLGVTDVRVTEVSIASLITNGGEGEFRSDLLITLADGTKRKGVQLDSLGGIVSTRRSTGAKWHIDDRGNPVIDELPTIESGEEKWSFSLADSQIVGVDSFLKMLQTGKVEDVLVNFTYEGQRYPWL